ncbi:hypothetical protein VNO77_05867 [Canavalia gladiata]|uniref:Uncharacterized protein n=1 Tax=Canavalia gladiata TaxID=3824 RepID=A0AAN9MZ44_CANGL
MAFMVRTTIKLKKHVSLTLLAASVSAANSIDNLGESSGSLHYPNAKKVNEGGNRSRTRSHVRLNFWLLIGP